MTNEDAIVRLLTEIRDAQREELAHRRQVIAESMRLQRSAIRWQRSAAIMGAFVVIAGIVYLATIHFSRPAPDPDISNTNPWERAQK